MRPLSAPPPEPDRPARESVWDYPRPPRLERVAEPLRVLFAGQVLAESRAGYRVLETSHPPTYYLPPQDVRRDWLRPSPRRSFCEYKGAAVYWSILAEGGLSEDAAWSYPAPAAAFRPIAGYLAFYPGRVESCWVGEERVTPQPGGFYGGWITARLDGPFKGGPGSLGW